MKYEKIFVQAGKKYVKKEITFSSKADTCDGCAFNGVDKDGYLACTREGNDLACMDSDSFYIFEKLAPCPDCGGHLTCAPGVGVKCQCGYKFCY